MDYTVTVENTGTAPYPGATFTDDLTEVLDDATYGGGATADIGTVTYALPNLTWTGTLAPGEIATVTYSVTVHDPLDGDGELTNAVVGGPGSSCEDGTESGCTTTTPVRELTITKTSTPAVVSPGDEVSYEITVVNTGTAPYPASDPATFTDNLAEVLDDATFNDDEAADNGTVIYVPGDENLVWSGALAPGDEAVITYSVTVNDPVSGDGELSNAVFGGPGSNCQDGTEDGCTTTTPVRALEITKTVAPTGTVAPGDDLVYTVTVDNIGTVDYTAADPAEISDDLSDVLDDTGDPTDITVAPDQGTAAFAAPDLTWSGPLAAGDTVTITYTVTLDDPPTGDGELTNAVTGPPESTCADPTDAGCTTTTLLKSLTIEKSSDAGAAVTPGQVIEYEITVENTGQVAYTTADPAELTDDLSEVLDDATYNDDEAADLGTPSYAEPELAWSGPLLPGEIATITYSVTVDNPSTGDGVLTNAVTGPPESSCADGDEDGCTTTGSLRELEIAKTSDAGASVVPGQEITYTVSVTNTGQTPYTVADPATFTDDLSDVLDDTGDPTDITVTPARGTATFLGTTLTWSGPLGPNDTVEVSYTVTVDDPVTGDGAITNAVTGPPESNCDLGIETGCLTTVPVRSLQIEKSGGFGAELQPGDPVVYTIAVTNTGQVDYTGADPAVVEDDLSEVLDDATLDESTITVTPDQGTATFVDPTLTWSGPLAAGDVVVIRYTLTVDDPLTGDGQMTNTVTGPPESNCDSGDEEGCATTVPVRSLVIEKTSDAGAEVGLGDTITYEVTVTNNGQVAFDDATPAAFEDDLSAVLDDATYGDATADRGTVDDSALPTLAWSGPLAPGQTATISYTVTVDDPPTGDGELTNAVSGPPYSTCADPTQPGCTTTTLVRALEIVKTADTDEVVLGDTITYTIEVTNTGGAPYTAGDPAEIDDDLTEVLDDATYNNDAASTVGGAPTYAAPTLSWSGPLAADETATITYTVTINDPATGDGVLLNLVTGPPESTCADPDNPGCTVVLPPKQLTITKTASPAGTVSPGGRVTYTVRVENTGDTDYTAGAPAAFTDDLTDVLDNASYDNDQTASAGTASYAAPELSWSGPLAVGAVATITYSVTVDDPVLGDGELVNAVTGPPESNCRDADPVPECTTTTTARGFSVEKTASVAEALPGDTVTYTVTVTNKTPIPYTSSSPASFEDDLSEVLDDATYDNDVSATGGAATVTGPSLSWSGPLAANGTVTVTYSVTVEDPDPGDGILDNVVVAGPSSNCPAGSTDPDCAVEVPVRQLHLTKAASTEETSPGATVTYTVKVTNTGGAAYPASRPATFTDDLAEVLDDATYNDDASASVGVTTYDEPILRWSGPLDVGQTATVTYSVDVNDPLSGDGVLGNDLSGPPEGNCSCVVKTPIRALDIVKTIDAPDPLEPGDTFTYTVTVTNTGQVPYAGGSPAELEDDLSGVLDDATYNRDATSNRGSTSYDEPVLGWTGPLPAGATAVMTYSFTLHDPLDGDGELDNAVVSATVGSPCVTGKEDPCTVNVKAEGSPPPESAGGGPGPWLPGTGSAVAAWMVLMGLVLLTGGIGLVALARRRWVA